MLKLEKITKNYVIDKTLSVHALKGIDLEFPKNGFVSILGQSGCGKTTLLNIIGGLDRYTTGDLQIDGKSTKEFSDKEWDNYRNKKIGMVFQSYNLISHMTVLGNVEIAMTLSGVSRSKRREVAKKALESVGLGGELDKKPNQLSGGQMQRVAIARAIVNVPNVILADEPTGALDSVTSVQILNILGELAKDKLVIMVTHNRNLALTYSSRVIEMSDGLIFNDVKNIPTYKSAVTKENENQKSSIKDNSFTMIEEDFDAKLAKELSKDKRKEKDKTSMSFGTAISISGRNLRTKKGRTIATAIAGSIGIVGVALVLAISNGFGNYLSNLETETLAQFPVSVEQYSYDADDFTSGGTANLETYPENHDVIVTEPASASFHVNNIDDAYINYVDAMDENLTSDVQYNYSLQSNVLAKNSAGDVTKINTTQSSFLSSYFSTKNYWYQLPDSQEFILSQYDVIEGDYPTSKNDVVLVVDAYNSMYKSTLTQLGYDSDEKSISVPDVLNHEFKLVSNNNYYTENSETTDVTGLFLKTNEQLADEGLSISQMQETIAKASTIDYTKIDEPETQAEIVAITTELKTYFNSSEETKALKSYSSPSDEEKKAIYDDDNKTDTLNVVGILRPKESTVSPVLSTGIYYTKDLVDSEIVSNATSAIADDYTNHLVLNSSTNLPSLYNIINDSNKVDLTIDNMIEEITSYFTKRQVYGTDLLVTSITIFPKDFDSKADILSYLDSYNIGKDKNDQVKYSDLAGSVTSTLETLISIISSVLIAFASISLIVSSVMIGVITHTSVIERTKEIGILRAVGARKKDVSRLFEAEAMIIGGLSGIVGITVTYALSPIINVIVNNLNPSYEIGNIASLVWWHALALIGISILLTFMASLIPARAAAHKDPVVALRTE